MAISAPLSRFLGGVGGPLSSGENDRCDDTRLTSERRKLSERSVLFKGTVRVLFLECDVSIFLAYNTFVFTLVIHGSRYFAGDSCSLRA